MPVEPNIVNVENGELLHFLCKRWSVCLGSVWIKVKLLQVFTIGKRYDNQDNDYNIK